MPDFNLSNAGWLAIIAVVLASQVLLVWAVYLIVGRGYRREIADLQEQVSALNERLQDEREPSGGMLTLLTGLFLSILFLLAAIYFAWWLFRPTGEERPEPAKIQIDPPAKVEPAPKPEQQEAKQPPNPETVRIRRQYPCCCPPDYYFGRNDDYYWRPGLGWTLRHGA
jgi:hypothetical protein